MQTLTYGQLIRGNRDFRNLLSGQFISELGNWFNFIAGLGLIRTVSDASPIAAAIFLVCRVLPFALISPIAGTFVDRFSRRSVMLASDIFRAGAALLFLLVHDSGDLWLAYSSMIVLSVLGAFFEGAKNAATPNLTGREGLLAGTALMFSTRFLLMAIGSALGGWASAYFGYQVAFMINAVSFLISAYTIWLIPEEATRDAVTADRMSGAVKKAGFLNELKEGIVYASTNHFALTILLMNVIWALGGGAINILFERVGGVYFSSIEGWNPDIAVALLWTVCGAGLAFGMLIAHRASVILERRGRHTYFIGWALILHGVLYAFAGLMPTLMLYLVFTFVSRVVIGVEYAVQETLFQQSLPDHIRGRVSTLDRGAELTTFGVATFISGELMYVMSPMTLTVFSALISGGAGVVWFLRQGFTNEKLGPQTEG